MKAVLMSIHPKWCEKIFNGEKTVEVRKVAPKLEPPFKVYVYESIGQGEGAGAVVGEFVCDTVEENIPDYNPAYERFFYNSFECGADCLTSDEIAAYGKGKPLYGWHISDLKIYDTPKELSEFRKPDEPFHTAEINENGNVVFCDGYEEGERLTRPPQSFMYVEDEEQ